MPTDKLVKLLSEKVYLLDSKHEKYTPLKVGEVKIFEGNKYQILKTIDNPKNGLQAMAVAPVKDGKVDTSEVIIAYAGTNAGDLKDIETDLRSVMGLMDKTASPGFSFGRTQGQLAGQVKSAEKFAKGIAKKYPSATITTTGHSLGQFLALYIAAENQWGNVGFNGPDPYSLLSKKAKQWVKENPGMLYNYRNKADIIGNFGGNETGAEILVDMDSGNNPLVGHQLSGWQFDKEGNLVISDNDKNGIGRRQFSEKKLHTKLASLGLLANYFESSGTGFTTNEQIYLEDAEALALVETLSEFVKKETESLVKIYQDAITEAEELWEDGLRRARGIGVDLSEVEILEALAAGNATRELIVEEPRAYYQDRIAKAKEIGNEFHQLAVEIKESLGELVEMDKELARKLS